ncbi:hypothetical protein [Sporosarcina sp. FA9]|uniref:hypothetical protein n=1 Tax=Sporosarcina sp. FA9 TaxID=3413030 RepID=UPI003F659A05
MMSLFKTKKSKAIDKYFESMKGITIYLFMNLKEEFPVEVIWFMPPSETNINIRARDMIPALIFKVSKMLEEVPNKVLDSVQKELFKRYELSEMILNHYSSWNSSEYDVFISENPTASDVDVLGFTAYNMGAFLCLELQEEYRLDGQSYSFTVDFAKALGELLLDVSIEFTDYLK